MLDLDRVVPQIEAMAREQAQEFAGLQRRLGAGLAQWRAAAAEPERWARLPRERNEPRLALPTHEPLDYCPSAAAAPPRYGVMAVDGSQIEPDFHEIAPCYLINVGHALLRYGPAAAGTRLGSEPWLFYPTQWIVGSGQWAADQHPPPLPTTHYPLSTADDVRFGSWGDLDAQRMLAEAAVLARLLREQAAREEPALAFLDGPLIAWRLDWITPQAAKQAATRNFLRSFTEARAAGIPLAGYISRTRSTDLVNLLKFSACRTAVDTGSFCAACAAGFQTDPTPSPSPTRRGGPKAEGPAYGDAQPGKPSELSPPSPSMGGGPGAEISSSDDDRRGDPSASSPPFPCREGGRGVSSGSPTPAPCYAPFDGLLDRQLLAPLLPTPGMRSPVFASNSSVLTNLYGEHRFVGFFFLNTGGEIARVELPQWVWEDAERLAMVHALVYDQVSLGRGYPIALSEAHEQAVVAASERALFFDLVRRAYGRHDITAELSSKALRKRGPIA